jgi:hypothetical protein
MWSTSSLLAVITVVLVKAPHHWPVATWHPFEVLKVTGTWLSAMRTSWRAF